MPFPKRPELTAQILGQLEATARLANVWIDEMLEWAGAAEKARNHIAKVHYMHLADAHDSRSVRTRTARSPDPDLVPFTPDCPTCKCLCGQFERYKL